MATCPCDELDFPPPPDIAAGLSRLDRQIATSGAFRLALLDEVDRQRALDDWRARDGDDFGLMIVEWWAYVLDVLAFYSSEIANESYLATARREASMRQLVELIGYSPKPALAASATLALFAENGPPVKVPPGTGFRSDAFDDEAPQVFEATAAATIDATLNEWRLAAIRKAKFGPGPLLLAADTASVQVGQILLLGFSVDPATAEVMLAGTRELRAARVRAVETVTLLDGASYVRPDLDSAPTIHADVPLSAITLSVPTQSAGMNVFAGSGAVSRGSSAVSLMLDAVYPQIRVGAPVVLEDVAGGRLHAAAITAVTVVNQALVAPSQDLTAEAALGKSTADRVIATGDLPLVEAFEETSGGSGGTMRGRALVAELPSTTVSAPFTRVTLAGAGPAWIASTTSGGLTFHFRAVTAGTATRAAEIEIGLGNLTGGAALEGPVEPIRQPTGGTVALRDARETGVALSAKVTDDGAGVGTLTPLSNAAPFGKLRTPVNAHGNLVTVTRGETVEEILGAGDATQSFQTFTLTKKPLTYLAATGTAEGRASTLEIWVDAVRWTEVTSFFGRAADARVYTVRQTVDGEFEVTFGGQGTGQPLPTGATVTARYRYGAGAASPPAGAIRQLAKPVKGLRRVVNPLAAFGGDDGDDVTAIRTAAPDSALSLGRAISLLDFEAIARSYRGILNATARADWDEREQRAAVVVWVIPPTKDGAEQLRGDLARHLRDISAPATPITVKLAKDIATPMSFDLAAESDRDPSTVQAAAASALAKALAVETIPIGAPVFRADLLAVLKGVDGVATVRGLTVDGKPAPFALETAEGEYIAASIVSPG